MRILFDFFLRSVTVQGEMLNSCFTQSRVSVEKWRRQRRTLERMPTHLAEALLHRLLHRRLLFPALLEVFQRCIEQIDMKEENSVDAEWMAYLGSFRFLRTLNLADCKNVTNSALWYLTGMASLKELDLSRCSKITDAGIEHLWSIPNLMNLSISETKVTAEGVTRLSSLRYMCVLDLGGLPVTDLALCSLQVLTQLEHLDLWGSKITNKGSAVLRMFPKLKFLNLAWTNVTKLLNLQSLTCLNMSGCTIESIFVEEVKAPLEKLLLLGATFLDAPKALSSLDLSRVSFLDISGAAVGDFSFLNCMTGLKFLDLSSSRMVDSLMVLVASIGVNLRDLNLGHTRVSSHGVSVLAGSVPNLETLSLAHTAVEDTALSYLSLMPSLRKLNLSHTDVKGFIYNGRHKSEITYSLTALQNLDYLESLNLEETQIRDGALCPLSLFRELSHLYLKNDFLSDISLHSFSSISKLKSLGLRGAVLTNAGLLMFKPPAMLQTLDLRECWLLTEDAILAFCENHHQINLRHEIVQNDMDQNIHNRSSMHHGTSKMIQLRPRRGKGSYATCGIKKEIFAVVDERIKYSKEELLSLQFVGLSLQNFGTILPKMLLK